MIMSIVLFLVQSQLPAGATSRPSVSLKHVSFAVVMTTNSQSEQ